MNGPSRVSSPSVGEGAVLVHPVGSSRQRRRARSRFWARTAAFAVVAFVLGLGIAWAAFSVVGVNLHGAGNYIHGARLTFFTQASVWTSNTPSTVPGAASTTVGTPTVLPATGQSYMINSGTAGHGAVQWNFSETTTPPHSTEMELTFTITSGSVPTTTIITVYLETQASNPASTLTFVLYFDAGAGTAVLDKANQVTQQCNAVASCP